MLQFYWLNIRSYNNSQNNAFEELVCQHAYLIYLTKFKTRQQAYDAINSYIELEYNRIRIHSSIGYLTPHVCEKRYCEQQQAA